LLGSLLPLDPLPHLLSLPVLLCWVEYIVAFTKVFAMYQLYHTCIQPLHHSPLLLPNHDIWNTFNR
jgi:hypothetical protein